jgi:hypothetical protein
MLHLLVGVGNNLVEGLVDTKTLMSIMSTFVLHELGIMHLVTSMEFYKTT